ncbi:hypothetical protein C922_03385 [Plasmodium inui San Antonio 1]|uniref:Uncharacterized protein n=1 Tax=Plasmodium inui San Antonio 1 TaxID=1237626 RepID=W7A3G3_9APIC|nr:hypothetical protein C922_03385 [Plasmodium inui San Antonio 1]EUD66190.1 hypothetical protein C922_03385 [Plasmodium inui San Antonio 1]
MKQNQGTNNAADEETTNPEANAQVVTHGISHPDGTVDLARVTVQYSVYSSCLLLLSSLQLHFMCEEKSSKKKKKKRQHIQTRYTQRRKKIIIMIIISRSSSVEGPV